MTIFETLMEPEEAVYYYESLKPGLRFEEYLLSTADGEKVKMPFVRVSKASVFSPVETSSVVLKVTDAVNSVPVDVEKFLDISTLDVSKSLTSRGVPNKPVISVISVKNGGKLKLVVGRTFLHDVFLAHHLADYTVAGETLRNIFAGETIRFAKKLSDPVLPSPLKISLVFLSRDGYVVLVSKGNIFSPGKKELSPVSIYPTFPFGREIVSLGDLIRKNIPEELLRGSLFRVFSTHVDMRSMGEFVICVLVVSNKSAIEIKNYLRGKPLPLNVVRLPKFRDFKNRRVTVMRILAESIESFANTIGVSYEVFPILNE